jgi:hypothetical protein
MDYRAAQFLARWFTPESKIKFLSNVMHSLGSEERRQILLHRIAPRHHAPERLQALADEYGLLMRRRDVAAQGILFRHDSQYELRSFAATKLLQCGDIDSLAINQLAEWSQRAVQAAGQFVALAEPRALAMEPPAAA